MSNAKNLINPPLKSLIFSWGEKTVLAIALVIAFTSFASAQKNEFEFVKTQFNSDRKTLLIHYMTLSDSQAAKFWPIYNDYERERSTLADARFTNLMTYADQYKTMSGDQADKMINTYFDSSEKEDAMKKKYYGKVKKELGALTAASWIQFEEYVDATVRAELLERIPFLNQKQ